MNRTVEKKRVESVDCYHNLANAIVLLAVKDYVDVLCQLELSPSDKDELRKKKQLEKFFHSSWYGILTELDPNLLMEGAKKQAHIEAEKRRKKAQEKLRREIKTLFRMLKEAGAVICREEIQLLRTW